MTTPSKGSAVALDPEDFARLQARLEEAEATLRAIRDGEVDAVVVLGIRRSTQIYTLHSAEEPYRLLVERMQEGALTLTAEGSVLYANQSVARMLGLPLEQVVGQTFDRHVTATDQANWTSLMADGLAGRRERAELFLARADGALVPVQASISRMQVDEVDGVCAILTDLTDRRYKEEIASAERLARAILDHATEAMVVCNASGTITHASQAAHRLAGRDPVGLAFTDAFALRFVPSDAESFSVQRPVAVDFDAVLASARSGRIIQGVEAELTGSDHGVRHLMISAGPLSTGPGQMVGCTFTLTDITARRQMEALLAGLNADLEARVEERTAQLAQAQKMEAIGQLTGGVAHDFNNLLQGIGSCLFVLDRHVPEGLPRTLFEAAQQSIERGARLTQSLLAFARRQTLKPRPTDLWDLLDGMRPLLERTLGGLIRVGVEVPSGTSPALVDRAQLESALLNLAINARDAMPSGGRLTLRASDALVVRSNEPGRPQDLKPGRYVVLCIEDTGVGMDAGTLARVFEPFFSTKEVGKGSGLGLSMVHGMAAQSGGGVAIASAVGQGTVVSLYLPSATSNVEMRPSAATDVANGDGRVVLLVDDDEIVRAGTGAMLQMLGYHVLTADGGAAALGILRSGVDVDALVADYAMPGMNGAALAEEARRIIPDLPALLISGYADKPDGIERLTLLQKPFRPAQLSEHLMTILAKGRRRNAPLCQ